MSFVYFLPNLKRGQLVDRENRLSRALLAERGLAEVLADVRDTRDAAIDDLPRGGPEGQPGLTLCPLVRGGPVPARLGYHPAEQTWTEVLPGKQWLGYTTGAPPGPEQLARRRQYEGYRYELADERRWQIPIIRRIDGLTMLPRAVAFEQGRAMATVKQQHRQLYEDFAKAWQLVASTLTEQRIPVCQEYLELAIRVLGVNYRYGLAEQNVIGAVDCDFWQDVLFQAMDGPFYMTVAQKKTTPTSDQTASGTIASGSTEDCLATSPASAS